MAFGSFDDAEDGEYNGVDFVDISSIIRDTGSIYLWTYQF